MTIRIAPALALVSLVVLACSACTASTDGEPDIAPASPSATATNPPSKQSSPDFPVSMAPTPGVSGSASAHTPTAPGSGTASDTGSAGGTAVTPAPATPLRTVTTRSAYGTSYVVKVWARRRDTSCSEHAYGKPMMRFLTEPDAFNALGQDNGVSVYDVWYLTGPTPNNDKALLDMTQDIFLQV